MQMIYLHLKSIVFTVIKQTFTQPIFMSTLRWCPPTINLQYCVQNCLIDIQEPTNTNKKSYKCQLKIPTVQKKYVFLDYKHFTVFMSSGLRVITDR